MTRRAWLRARLDEAGVSQEELGRRLGCAPSTVSRWAGRSDEDEANTGALLIARRWGAPRVTRAKVLEALRLEGSGED